MFENKSILEITSLIKSKEATVKEVVKFYLERIKKYNPALNAIVLQKEEEQIFHEINLKDNEDNKSKPLFGLPLACKDLFDIEGIPSTYGFPPYKNNIAKKNSLIVDRLINSGAIIIGKTNTAELDKPLVLIVESEVENVRKIQSVLEYAIKQNRSLLIIADVDQQVMSALAMNKLKGNIKVNLIEAPVYGVNKKETLEDLALLTGATIINEDLGDDIDLIGPEHLGEIHKSVTSQMETILHVGKVCDEVEELIKDLKAKLKTAKHPGIVVNTEKRLARLSGKVAVVKVGANSEVELKEKKDRVEDAICATKAAIKEGIVPGGGIALLNASQQVKTSNAFENILLRAIKAPFKIILSNAGIAVSYTHLTLPTICSV